MTGGIITRLRGLIAGREHYADLALLLGGRGVSALASLAVIPLVSRTSGALSYGQFSLDYSLLLAVIALFSTVCMQPTYRGYDGSAGGGVYPKLSILASGGAAAVSVLALGVVFRRPLGDVLAGTALVLTQTLYSGMLSIRQIQAGAKVMSAYELVRGVYTLAIIGLALALNWRVDGASAFVLLASGYAAASVWLCWRADLSGAWPLATCLRLMRFGALMGLWLAIGNLTYLILKLLMKTYAAPADFAQFTINIDIAGRVVGLVGSMVVTNYFPSLAKLARENRSEEMDRLVGKATWAYIVLSLGGAIAWVVAWAMLRPEILGELGAMALIFAGVGLYQYGSIFHKRLELSGRASLLLVYLVVAQGLGIGAVLATKTLLGPLDAVITGLGVIGGGYLALTHLSWIRRRPQAFRPLDSFGPRADHPPLPE